MRASLLASRALQYLVQKLFLFICHPLPASSKSSVTSILAYGINAPEIEYNLRPPGIEMVLLASRDKIFRLSSISYIGVNNTIFSQFSHICEQLTNKAYIDRFPNMYLAVLVNPSQSNFP